MLASQGSLTKLGARLSIGSSFMSSVVTDLFQKT